MTTSLSDKLKIKENTSLLIVNAPPDFKKTVGPLPEGVRISSLENKPDQVHWFVMHKQQMEKELKKILPLVKNDVLCWIYYPKGTSGIQTDLSRDKGWDSLLSRSELQWVSLISFDDTWSTFGFRLKTEADKKKAAKPKEKPVLEYVDPVKKTVTLPDDLAAALKKHKSEETFFNSLSFTNKKEYLEWIVTAKKDETRQQRIEGTIERLGKEWKNPRNM